MSGRLVSPRQTPRRGSRGNSNVPSESPLPAKKDKRIEQQLGPEWSQDEITTFFTAVKEGRHDWEAIARGMPGRASENLKNLYHMHKDYLALDEATSLGLFTILRTIYNIPYSMSSHEDGDGDVGATTRSRSKSKTSVTSRETSKTPTSKQPSQPRKTRKKLFSDELSPPHTSTTPTRTPSPPPRSTPSSNRKRKTPSRHDSPPSTPRTPSTALNTSLTATPDSQLPLKLRGKALKGKISPLKIEGTPKSTPNPQPNEDLTPAQKIIHDRLVGFLKSHSAKATQHEVPLSPAGIWAVYEWFYADVDRVYFQVNEFQECLNELGLSKIRKLTRVEWSHVRSAMGKPRRLSRAFLKQERTKLHNTRKNVRMMRIGETPLPGSTADSGIIPADIPSTLTVGAPVLVYDNKALKKGVVQHAESDGSRYRVLLDGHSNAVWIEDVFIMSMYAEDAEANDGTPQPLRGKEALLSSATKRRKILEMTSPANGITRNGATPLRKYTKEEMRNIAALSVLLEKKESLVSELTAMNNQAEKMLASSQEYPSWFQQRYAYLIVQLDGVNRQLEPTLLQLHASRTSPTVAPPIARASYADISLLDFRESSNWSENSVNECKQQSQHIVNEYMQSKFSGPPSARDYVSDCVSLLLQLQACANHVRAVGPEDASPDVIASLDYSLANLRPKSEENMQLFSEIEQSVAMLKNKLTIRSLTHT